MFTFIPVTEQTYWTIPISDVRVEYVNRPMVTNLCPPAGCTAIVDTGTYLIYGPEDQFRRTGIQEINNCNDMTQMPTLHFDFLSDIGQPVTLSLHPQDYILKFEMDQNGIEDCVIGLSPDKDTIWTLGQVNLSFSNLDVIHDLKNVLEYFQE